MAASRGKGPDFWQPYIEEWQNPPSLDSNSTSNQFVKNWFGGWLDLFVVKNSRFFYLLLLVSGFTSLLLESIPIVGFFSTISNRAGARCSNVGSWYIFVPWMDSNLLAIVLPDLEKRQHLVASQRRVGGQVHNVASKMD